MSEPRRRRPAPVKDVLSQFLERSGLDQRVEQAHVIPEWPSLVGKRIASVTAPLSVSADGTLLVAVSTHSWMTELSLMEPELLRALNAGRERASRVARIRWVLRR